MSGPRPNLDPSADAAVDAPPAVLRIVFRSGAELEADIGFVLDSAPGQGSPLVDEDAQTQRLLNLTWQDAINAARRLLYVDPDEVAAVMVIGAPSGAATTDRAG